MMKVFSEQTEMVAENLADTLTEIILENGRERDMMKKKLSEYISVRGYKVDDEIIEYLQHERYDFLADLLEEMTQEEKKNNIHPELKKLAELETDKEYTIFMYGEFGFPVSIKIKLESATVERYAQYENAIKLVFKRKNKRYLKDSRVMYLLPYQEIVVWEGHQEVETDMWGKTIKEDENIKVRESKGTAFAKVYVEDALKSVTEKPVVEYRGK